MELLEMPSPLYVSEVWWTEVAKKSRNSAIFIDNIFCESLHWCGGTSRLWNAGCKEIKSFSSFEKCDDNDNKAIFLISSVISETPLQILKDIISISNLQHVTIISAAAKSIPAFSEDSKEDTHNIAMTELENKILSWLHKDNSVVEIFSLPILLLPIAEDVFLMPKFRKMYPILESEIPAINQILSSSNKPSVKKISNLNELELEYLPFPFRQEIKHLISVFHNVFQVMNVREEIFSIGQLSSIIAAELDAFTPAKLRRRTASRKISLVLIDRVMDLGGPVSINTDSLMGKIISTLDSLPNHNIDCSINLSPVSSVHPSCEWTLIPGCFNHCEEECIQFLNKAIKYNNEDAMQFLSEKIRYYVEELGENSSNNLLENVKILFNSSKSVENYFGLIQQALGIIESQELYNNANGHQKDIESCQQSILQTINEESSVTMTELLKLLGKRKQRYFSLEDILSIMLYVVSIGGQKVLSESMQYEFVNSFSLAFLDEKDDLPSFLLELVNGEIDDLSALKLANKIWNIFIDIASVRKNLKEYRDISSNASEAETVLYENFVVRLVKDCITKGQVNDLEYKSSGFKNIIKSGFSLFVNVTKPMPKEASMMIVYIVGGITTDEVKQISELVRDVNPNLKVVIGSSHFTKTTDALENLLQNNPLIKCS